jgi:hypothetical protein
MNDVSIDLVELDHRMLATESLLSPQIAILSGLRRLTEV